MTVRAPEPPDREKVATPPSACEAAGKREGGLRWLVFETVSESGVMRVPGWEQGALTSLDPAFEATVAAVIEALAWKSAITTGPAPCEGVREAVEDTGPRAILAWDALEAWKSRYWSMSMTVDAGVRRSTEYSLSTSDARERLARSTLRSSRLAPLYAVTHGA